MASSVDLATTLGHAAPHMQKAALVDAIDDRRAWTGFERGEGVATFGSFRVSEKAGGANLSVDVNQDDGAWVRGDSVADQGLYYVARPSGVINLDVAASDGTNPRVDIVVLEVLDHEHDNGGLNKARVRVITGTPTATASLDNRLGAAATPSTAILLADVLRPASDAAVQDAEIRDRRPFSARGTVPPLQVDTDMVAFETPVPTVFTSSGVVDLSQYAALMYLPRRIVNATKIRWRYRQGAGGGGTALTGNYVLAVYDASGRRIVDTGSVAFAGAAGAHQQRTENIAATTFEPGWYYLLFGVDTTNAGNIELPSVNFGLGWAYPHALLVSITGGVTPPNTLLAFIDGPSFFGVVPMAALSVG